MHRDDTTAHDSLGIGTGIAKHRMESFKKPAISNGRTYKKKKTNWNSVIHMLSICCMASALIFLAIIAGIAASS